MRLNILTTTLVSLSVLIAGCGNNNPTSSSSASGRKIAPRDTSIHPGNASNPFFIDSNYLETFISKEKLGDTLADGMRSFYNHRNFQYAWIGRDGLTEQALLFKSMYDFGNDSNAARKKLDARFDELVANDFSGEPSQHLNTELQLTWRFVRYVDDIYPSEDERNLVLEEFVPRKRRTLQEWTSQVLEDEAPVKNDAFGKLREKVGRYADIVKNGGWNTVNAISDIPSIKKRLSASGEYTDKDTSAQNSEAFKQAVRQFQETHGFEATGALKKEQLEELNVPAADRLVQILVNLERMKWMPAPPSAEARSVMVNIPEFRLYASKGKDSAFAMNVVVGKEAHNTILFSGTLNQVVFSPYWNVPRSIVRNELLPAMEKNANYLAEKDMEITGEENGLPVIRQRPGEKNALGKVKFLFPNAFNIYFHDSPEKHLFDEENRAFSHGCIRLADPIKMASFCLEGMDKWNDASIRAAMNQGKEEYVKLKEPVQVQIAYYTAWVDVKGRLQFRKDLYGHDDQSRKSLL